MKIGMPILFEYDTLEDNFILAKELGFDFIELNLNFGYCREAMEKNEVLPLVNKYKIETTLHFFDEADLGTYDEVVDAYFILLKKYMALGKDYVKLVNFHNNPGPVVTISGIKNYMYQKEYDTYLPRIIKSFHEAEKIVNEYGAKMVIENVDTAPKATFLIDNFKYLKKEGFRFNYDIGHDNICNDALFELNKKEDLPFDEFHFHDGNRKTCHLSLGEGTIDLKTYKDLAIKNNAWVLLEVKSSEDLRKSITYFKNL